MNKKNFGRIDWEELKLVENNRSHRIYCEQCADEIHARTDLVAVLRFVSVVAYHVACYGRRQLGFRAGGTPLNGTAIIVLAVFSFVICAILALVTGRVFFWVLALIVPALRLYSWLSIERYVNG